MKSLVKMLLTTDLFVLSSICCIIVCISSVLFIFILKKNDYIINECSLEFEITILSKVIKSEILCKKKKKEI